MCVYKKNFYFHEGIVTFYYTIDSRMTGEL